MNIEIGFDAITSRLKLAVGVSSDGQLAARLGLSASAYANLKSRGSVPYEKVIVLAITHNVNLHWLFTSDECEGGQRVSELQLFDHSSVALAAWQIEMIENQIKQFQEFNQLKSDVAGLRINYMRDNNT